MAGFSSGFSSGYAHSESATPPPPPPPDTPPPVTPPVVSTPGPVLRFYPDTRELEVLDRYSPKSVRHRRRYP